MKIELEQVLPGQIEARSFSIIGDELAQMGRTLDKENELVIKRCIHTTADFEYADSLVFSDHAVREGIRALKAGAHIVTDTPDGLVRGEQRTLRGAGGRGPLLHGGPGCGANRPGQWLHPRGGQHG